MQRLFSLGMLAAILGGGYALLNGMKPADIGRVVQSAGGVLQGGSQNQTGYGPAPGYGTPPPNAGGSNYNGPGYAPAPAAPASVIRIASFNIQVFGTSKSKNVNVMRTLAAIVQNFDIVAIQEIRTKDDFLIDNFLRDFVNAGGRRYSRIVGPRLGRSNSKEQYVYLFDTRTIQVNPQLIYTVNDDHSDLLHREPLVTMFATRTASPFTFILINTHTDPDETDQELDALAQVVDVVRREGPGEDDVILLGDLNTNVPIKQSPQGGPFGFSGRGRQLAPKDLRALGRISGIYPVIRDEPTNTRRSRLHDNILINRLSTTEFTGRAGVFDIERQYGLTREQALMVSDHLPVWAEFSATEVATPGRLAQGVDARRQ